jgi:hypothetical protein
MKIDFTFGDLDPGIALPAGWPDHLSIKTDDPGRMPPAALLGPHIAIFQDERMKELLVTPDDAGGGVDLGRSLAGGPPDGWRRGG